MSRAVTAALKDAQILPRDAGAVALIRRYAKLIDDAEALAEEAAHLYDGLDLDDQPAHARLARLAKLVDAQTVAADLGPKLLAALSALGMTLAGRQVRAPSKGGDGDVAGTGSTKLDELRARRAARQPGA